jgi:hypothetical protein
MNDISFPPIRRPLRLWLVFAAAWLSSVAYAAPDQPGDMRLQTVLDLPADGFLSGVLVAAPAAESGTRETLLWRSPMFAEPCEFAIDSIRGIRFPRPVEGPPPAAGDWRIELVDGDVLVGRIESIDERTVVAMIGSRAAPVPMAIRRESVARITHGGSGFFLGPAGLADWEASPNGRWREEGGRLIGESGATLFRQLGAGPRSRYDLVLSWKKPPAMQVAFRIGAAADEPAYRLEVGSFGMVAVRQEPATQAIESGVVDLEPLGDLPAEGIAMSVFIDEEAGRMAVVLPGKAGMVADFSLPPRRGQAGGGFRLAIEAGDVVLESLRVGPWSGEEPMLEADAAGSIRLQDGTTIAGELSAWKEDALVLAGADARRIPANQVAEILFPALAGGEATGQPRSVRLHDRWGSRLTGGIDHVEADALVLVNPALAHPVALPIDGLATLSSLVQRAEPRKLTGRIGRLESKAGACVGCLVAGEPSADAAGDAIAWQPQGSLTASPLAAEPGGGPAQATITYGAQPSQQADGDKALGGLGANVMMMNDSPAIVGWAGPPLDGIQPGSLIVEIAPNGDQHFVKTAGLPLEDVHNLLRGRIGTKVTLRLKPTQPPQGHIKEVTIKRRPLGQKNPLLLEKASATHDRLVATTPTRLAELAKAPFASTLILRTGETLPCRVESIDAAGVRVRMLDTDPVTISHDLVQAVELVPAPSQPLSRDKFRSLTVLPRSQEQDPPTHLVRSRNGDYLRGRLESLDGETARIAVEARTRGKTVAIPRAEVARLIWLHPENLSMEWRPPPPVAAAGLPLEAVLGASQRLRLVATAIDGNMLVGTSPVIGPCRIDIATVQMLRIGDAVTATPPSAPFFQWRLEPARDPRNLPPRKTAPAADSSATPPAVDPGAALAPKPVKIKFVSSPAEDSGVSVFAVPQRGQQRPPPKPRRVADGVAEVAEDNTLWVSQLGRFLVAHEFPPGDPEAGISTQPGPVGDLLRQWRQEGTAAGLHGVLYDNHDEDHSNMHYEWFPELTRVEYCDAAKTTRTAIHGLGELHRGLQVVFLHNAPVIGNASVAQTQGPFWRSMPRLALANAVTATLLADQYVNNMLYFYPEHRDHDPETDKGHGDVYPANVPYLITSQGSSGSDQAFLDGVAATIAAFRPETQRFLIEKRLLMPTVQMIFRRCRKPVAGREEYLSGIAHPPVFAAASLDVERMVRMAHDLEAEEVPPLVRLEVEDEYLGRPGVDYFEVGQAEKLFDTVAAVARVARSARYRRRLVASVAKTEGPGGKPLSFVWRLLHGDAGRVRITPLDPLGMRAEIVVDWHPRAVYPGSDLPSARVDVGVFADNGSHLSAPALLTWYFPPNERRVYEPVPATVAADRADEVNGDAPQRIVSIERLPPSGPASYADPMVLTPADWTDTYRYDERGSLLGWTRSRGDHDETFAPDGRVVVQVGASGEIVATKPVRYVREQNAPDEMPTLREEAGL